ncbi:MAG: hypothetical protein R2831_00355 [Chitinophagaceae bacterium]
MKINEIPQDQKQFKDGHNAPKKVMYVTQEDGTYTQRTSLGWEVENLALEQAWQDIDEQLNHCLQLIKENKTSPIHYYMIKNRMDIPILASYVGKWKWQVKRHFKPSVFKKLNEKTLQAYANAFAISIKELCSLS